MVVVDTANGAQPGTIRAAKGVGGDRQLEVFTDDGGQIDMAIFRYNQLCFGLRAVVEGVELGEI